MSISLLLSAIHQCVMQFPIDQITSPQITKFFNLSVDSPYDPNPINTIQQKFKYKLFDILQTQGPSYKDYLNLPKFSTLKQPTLDRLRHLFYTIWTEYERKSQGERNDVFIKELEKIVPQFKTLEEIQAFHLELFKCYKSSKLARQSPVTSIREQQQNNMGGLFPLGSNMGMESQFKRPRDGSFFMMGSQPNYANAPIQLANNANRMVFPKIEDDPKFNNSIWLNNDNKYVDNMSSFPIHKIGNQENSMFPLSSSEHLKPIQQQRMIINKNHHPQNFQRPKTHLNRQHPQSSSPQMSEQSNNPEIKSHITSNQDEFLSKLQMYMFVQCPCEGTLSKPSAKYMVCKKCQFYYHYQCLLMDQSTTADICPCCKLKQGTNLFVKIHQQAYGKRWCKNMKSQKLSLFLTEKQIQHMKQQRMNCKATSQIEYQLRFFKLTKKDNKSGSQSDNGNSRKFNNLPLPAYYIEKLQPFNQFEISLKPTDEDKYDECSYFFAIFIVEKFSQRSLTEELFSNITVENSVGEEYLKQLLPPGHEYLAIKMKDPTSQHRICYPVRGNRCQHPDVFDYLSILQYYHEYGQKLKEKHCSICELQIDSMIVDRFLYEKIKELEEKEEKQGENKQYEVMKYFGQGRVEFTIEENDDEDENNGDNYQDDEDEENRNNNMNQQNSNRSSSGLSGSDDPQNDDHEDDDLSS